MCDFKPYILISIILRRGRRNHFPSFLDKSDMILVFFFVVSVVLNFKMGHLFTIIKGTQKTSLQMWPEFLGKACGFTALGKQIATIIFKVIYHIGWTEDRTLGNPASLSVFSQIQGKWWFSGQQHSCQTEEKGSWVPFTGSALGNFVKYML